MKTDKRILMIIFAVLIPAISAHAQTQRQEGRIHAAMSVARKDLYQNEVFEITLTVRTENLRLGEEHKLLSLPPETQLEIRDYKAIPVKQVLRESSILEEHIYIYEACAVSIGKVVLSPVLRVGILTRKSGFLNSRIVETSYDVSLTPFTLNILPLPEAPGNFSGAVGRFDFAVDVAPVDVAPGDIIKATMKITGYGDLDRIKPPTISPGRNFKAYNARTLKTPDVDNVVFEQILIPQNTNAAVIPAVDFTYFNPDQGKYLTESAGPFTLTFHQQKTETVEYYRPDDEVEQKNQSNDSENIESSRITAPERKSIKETLRRLVDGTLFCKEAVTNTETQARLAPSSTSLIMFEIPENASVTIIAEHRNWTEISWHNNRGWIPARTMDLP